MMRRTVRREQNNKIKSFVKNNIARTVLSETIRLDSYSPGASIGPGLIKASKLVKYDVSGTASSDLITGNYRGVNICFSDVHLQENRKIEGETVCETVFRGQWLILELNKNIQGELRLRERRIGDKPSKTKSDIETENTEFNQKYQILTDNPHTAFLILTPHFMEYIIKMDARAKANTSMCFDSAGGKSKVQVAIQKN
jgi:hypothetical protein